MCGSQAKFLQRINLRHIVTSCILIQFAYAATSFCPCHGFTFSFTLPMSITTQLFFRCYAALRQAQGRHRNRQFGAHARGSMARPLPSQSFTSLPLAPGILFVPAGTLAHNVSIYQPSNYKTNTGACYLLFQALFNCELAYWPNTQAVGFSCVLATQDAHTRSD